MRDGDASTPPSPRPRSNALVRKTSAFPRRSEFPPAECSRARPRARGRRSTARRRGAPPRRRRTPRRRARRCSRRAGTAPGRGRAGGGGEGRRRRRRGRRGRCLRVRHAGGDDRAGLGGTLADSLGEQRRRRRRRRGVDSGEVRSVAAEAATFEEASLRLSADASPRNSSRLSASLATAMLRRLSNETAVLDDLLDETADAAGGWLDDSVAAAEAAAGGGGDDASSDEDDDATFRPTRRRTRRRCATRRRRRCPRGRPRRRFSGSNRVASRDLPVAVPGDEDEGRAGRSVAREADAATEEAEEAEAEAEEEAFPQASPREASPGRRRRERRRPRGPARATREDSSARGGRRRRGARGGRPRA